MKASSLFEDISKQEKRFYQLSMLSALLLAVAYISHLGFLEIDVRTDETRRALVTLEMMNRHEYLAPTLNAEPYLNKPPLYNWIIAASYKIFGVNTFALRFPVIVFTFLFGWVIYRFLKKYWNPYAAVLTALFFVSNGRILIYDSLQGLIDIGYSMFVYAGFMLTWHYGKKQNWWALFLSTYLLAAIGFLMKGLPSVVFQGISLLAFFALLQKNWKPLFGLAHAAGLALFLLIVGGYFVTYFNIVNITPAEFFNNLLQENTKRTFVASTPMQFLLHFVSYPFTIIYHFAPWAFMMILLVRRNLFSSLQRDEFIWFNAICFFGGLLIYWLSPNIMARYLFMILPLLFAVLLYLYNNDYPNGKVLLAFDYILLGVVALLAVGCLALPFVAITAKMPWVWVKSIFLTAALGTCAWLAWKHHGLRLSYLILAIVIMRFGFNWFVVENRGEYQTGQRLHAYKVIELAAGRPLYLQKEANIGNWDGISYHHLVKTGRILLRKEIPDVGDIMITDSVGAQAYPHKKLYQWPGHLQDNMWLVERTAQ
jgi:4-amino-4-deoxy-L-arabinose transferase-like glycosyltransferase